MVLPSQKPNTFERSTEVKRHLERKYEKEAMNVTRYMENPSSTEEMNESR